MLKTMNMCKIGIQVEICNKPFICHCLLIKDDILPNNLYYY